MNIECNNYHKHGHHAQDYPKKRDSLRPNYNNNCGFNNKKFNDRKRRDDRIRGDDGRTRDALDDYEEGHHPQNRSKNSRDENNPTASQSKYILIFSLSSSSPPDSCDSWLVDSGASRTFSRYWEVISNLVERETNLNIILGDRSPHPVKAFGSVKFHLDSWELVILNDVMYLPIRKKNFVYISTLEDKGMRVSFIKGKSSLELWSLSLGMLSPWDLELKEYIESMGDHCELWSMI